VEFSEKYQLVKRLGNQRKRKFGEIFLAVDRTQQHVVIKAVRIDLNDHLNAERLRSEAKFSFHFPGLPNTLDFEETETNVFLVRKYQEGIPLDNYWNALKRKKRLTFLIEFLEKLEPIFKHLREENVVHCDIKPSNILIEPTSSSFNVHLIDFGLALRTNQPKENEQRKLLFPLGFAAPELLLNHLEIVDQRTDLFALGVVIWRLYAGTLPLAHPNPSVFTNLQLTHPLPEHSEIPLKIYSILNKMAHKHQFKRPPNQLKRDEVIQLLISGMNGRYANLQEVISAFKALEKRRFWK
jgi:serine/threonine-protein kinase